MFQLFKSMIFLIQKHERARVSRLVTQECKLAQHLNEELAVVLYMYLENTKQQ